MQPYLLRKYPSDLRLKINSSITELVLKRKNSNNIFVNSLIANLFSQTKTPITSELAHYGDIVKVLGSQNVYAVDKFNPLVIGNNFSKSVYFDWENYPVSYGYLPPTFIKSNDIFEYLKNVNVILASIKYGPGINEILKYAKKNGVFVALFDNIDHEKMYLNQLEDPYRGFLESEFDIYFKKDIPIGLKNKRLIPIAPVPTKYEAEDIGDISWRERPISIYFRGAYREKITRQDRYELCELLLNKIPQTTLTLNGDHISESKYRIEALNSKILLSPAGRVWCSYRHTNLAKYRTPILMPRPNCITAYDDFQFDDDAIYYESEIINGFFVVKNFEKLHRKVEEVLSDASLAEQMSMRMYSKIMSRHTTYSRSKYIISKITQSL